MKVTKTQTVWWELFPIELGDRVKIKRTGEKGIVVGQTIPCYHTEEKHPKVFFYQETTYDIVLESDFKLNFTPPSREFKRWEIEKVE